MSDDPFIVKDVPVFPLETSPEAFLKDSGARRVMNTGGQRDRNNEKGRMDLLPMRALVEVSKLFEAGALKYSERNWEQGLALGMYVDSAIRHMAQFMIGANDEAHLTQCCWNVLCLLDTVLRIQDGIFTPEVVQELNNLPEWNCINDIPTIDTIRNSKKPTPIPIQAVPMPVPTEIIDPDGDY